MQKDSNVAMRASLPREGQSAPSCKRAPNVGHVRNNKMPAKGPPSPGRQTWRHSMRKNCKIQIATVLQALTFYQQKLPLAKKWIWDRKSRRNMTWKQLSFNKFHVIWGCLNASVSEISKKDPPKKKDQDVGRFTNAKPEKKISVHDSGVQRFSCHTVCTHVYAVWNCNCNCGRSKSDMRKTREVENCFARHEGWWLLLFEHKCRLHAVKTPGAPKPTAWPDLAVASVLCQRDIKTSVESNQMQLLWGQTLSPIWKTKVYSTQFDLIKCWKLLLRCQDSIKSGNEKNRTSLSFQPPIGLIYVNIFFILA